MPHSSKETLSIGWCDNGMTDGKFTEGLLYTSLTSAKHGIFINNAIRVQGIDPAQALGTDGAPLPQGRAYSVRLSATNFTLTDFNRLTHAPKAGAP